MYGQKDENNIFAKMQGTPRPQQMQGGIAPSIAMQQSPGSMPQPPNTAPGGQMPPLEMSRPMQAQQKPTLGADLAASGMGRPPAPQPKYDKNTILELLNRQKGQ